MKKQFVLILALALVVSAGLFGCEKKEAPQPAVQPTVTPAAPAPAPEAAPVAPEPVPVPAKPFKK